ncbi:MAG TPA: trehalase family glycosidase [Candidatus Paceibacterota bacterium]|nr:trehalase family glycosidase [Verrucomicrobiota bacterium]HSA10379.1 trehalase family glycosidase [Candidatus Paceibacterota bacterium]
MNRTPATLSQAGPTRRQFLKTAMLGSIAWAACRLRAGTNAPVISSWDSSQAAADRWLERQRRKVSRRDFELLRRAKEVLYRNILTEGELGKPLPWAPRRGICPAPGKYRGVWNWDGSFHALAVSRWDGELAREQLRIILDRQLPSGALINNIRASGLVRDRYGQPPVMPWVCALMHQRAPHNTFLASAYRQFTRFEQHWWRDRGGEAEGLFHYYADLTHNAKEDNQAIRFESGWDNSVRWDDGVELWTVDLNGYMVLFYRAMERMARWLGLPDEAQRWRARREALAAKINDRLFNPRAGAYLDRRRDTGQFSEALSPASFLPLFAGVAQRAKARAMAKLATDPARLFPGMPTVAYNHPRYESGGYWRGPSWPETTYFAAKGLKFYGYKKTAEALRQNLLNWCAMNADALYEYYDSKSGKGLGEPQLACTGALIIEFILNWDAPDNLAGA